MGDRYAAMRRAEAVRLLTERARLLALVTETEAEYRAKWTAINALNVRLVAS
jgi:hypothetical protein